MKTDNQLIAEYLGLERSKAIWERGEYAYTMKFPNRVFNKWVIPSDMAFEESWDWLMPVVQKIVKFQDDNFLNNNWKVRGIYWLHSSFHMMDIATPIDKVYFQVVKFIKWYNQYKSIDNK